MWALLTSPCRSFSFLFLFRLIPWGARALCIHFPAWASKTHWRRCLRWGTFRDSRGRLQPTWTEQVPCWGFIGFLSKPRNISLFSLLYFLNCKILSLSLYLFFCWRRPPEGIPGSNQGWTPVREGVYTWLICNVVCQKSAQHGKAIFFQFKKSVSSLPCSENPYK